jgi:hypothetical protein
MIKIERPARWLPYEEFYLVSYLILRRLDMNNTRYRIHFLR